MANKGKTASETDSKQTDKNERLEKIRSQLLCTGLVDYGYWWTEMLKEQATTPASVQSVQRGRIWS